MLFLLSIVLAAPSPTPKQAVLLVSPEDPRLPQPSVVTMPGLARDVRCRMRPLLDDESRITAFAPSPDCPPELVVQAIRLHRGRDWPQKRVGKVVLRVGTARFGRVPLQPPVWDVLFDGDGEEVVRYGWRADAPDAEVRGPVHAPGAEGLKGRSILVVLDEEGVPAGITDLDLSPPEAGREDTAWLVEPWGLDKRIGGLSAPGPRDPSIIGQWRWEPTGRPERVWVGDPGPMSPPEPFLDVPGMTPPFTDMSGFRHTSAEVHHVRVTADGDVDALPAAHATREVLLDVHPKAPWSTVRMVLERFPESSPSAFLGPFRSSARRFPEGLYDAGLALRVAGPEHHHFTERARLRTGPAGAVVEGFQGRPTEKRLLYPEPDLSWHDLVSAYGHTMGYLVVEPDLFPPLPELVDTTDPQAVGDAGSELTPSQITVENASDLPPGVPEDGPEFIRHAEVKKKGLPPSWPEEATTDPHARCVVLVSVDRKGVPLEVTVSGCPPVFQEATKKAVMGWRWYPVRIDGEYAAFRTQTSIDFRDR